MKKKNLSGRKRNRNKNRRIFQIIKSLMIIFILLLIVLLLLEFGFIKTAKKIFAKKKPIVIEGQCYSFMNTILYQINNEADCQKRCSNRCWVQKEDYKNSKFVYTPGSCNLCDCYCK